MCVENLLNIHNGTVNRLKILLYAVGFPDHLSLSLEDHNQKALIHWNESNFLFINNFISF